MVEKIEKKVVSGERVNEVFEVVKGLMKIVDTDGLREVESAQPENLKQYEAKDEVGNEVTYIRNLHGNLETPIEVRDSSGKLIAQSWEGKEWSVDGYIENGADFFLQL
jgi:hypothetical protein